MKNNKTRNTIILLVILFILSGIMSYQIYNKLKEKNNANTLEQSNQTTNNNNEEIKYPTSKGPIFNYNIDDLNENVSNKKTEIKYVTISESNSYQISSDRRSISIGKTTLNFEKEIYHACSWPYDNGTGDFWVILFRDGTVKYSTDYWRTIKDGPNRIIDVFAVEYKRAINNGETLAGGTVIVVNDYGTMIDLMNYQTEN